MLFSPFESSYLLYLLDFKESILLLHCYEIIDTRYTLKWALLNIVLIAFSISAYLLSSNIIMLLLILLLCIIIFYLSLIKTSDVCIVFFIMLHNFIYLLMSSYIESKTLIKIFYIYLFFYTIYIAISNILGLLPYSFSFHSHILNTFFMSFIILLTITSIGLLLFSFFFFNIINPSGIPNIVVPLLIIIELISFLFRLVSLSLRLFANILAGHILIHVLFTGCIYALLEIATGFSFIMLTITFLLNIIIFFIFFLELAVAFLQTYIYLVMCLIYLSDLEHLAH